MIFFGFNVHGHYSKHEWHAQTQTSCAGFTWHKLAEANKVVFRELETLSGGVMQHICFSYSPQDTLCHSLPTALGIQGKRGTAAGSRAVDLHSCKEMSRAEELNRRGQGSWERNKKRLCKGKKKVQVKTKYWWAWNYWRVPSWTSCLQRFLIGKSQQEQPLERNLNSLPTSSPWEWNNLFRDRERSTY